MPTVSATEASRNFSAILDEVEHRGVSYTVERHGREVARIAPAARPNGAAVIAALTALRAAGDSGMGDEIEAMRKWLRDDSLDHIDLPRSEPA